MCRLGCFWFLETKHMGFARRFSHNSPVYFVSIFFLRGAPQVGSAGTKKRQIANSFTGSPCICTRTLISIKIFVIITKSLRSGPALSEIPWGAPALGGGIETKPERNIGNPGVSFPPGKQKHAVRMPGPFHEKRNNHTGLFSWFLVHLGAPGKQCLKSPCFVSSNFSCFNFFPIYHTLFFYYMSLCLW